MLLSHVSKSGAADRRTKAHSSCHIPVYCTVSYVHSHHHRYVQTRSGPIALLLLYFSVIQCTVS